MSSIYALKGRFQALLRPAVIRLHRAGVTANQVTVVAALASMAVGAGVLLQAPTRPLLYLALPGWMLARMALNAIDGMLAREFGQQSALGAYLNELCDVLSDAALYLALLPVAHPAAVAALIGFAALTEYAGVLGLMVGATRRYDGPMGKSDRACAIGVLGALLAFGLIGTAAVDAVLTLLSALCVLTVIRRVTQGLHAAGAAR